MPRIGPVERAEEGGLGLRAAVLACHAALDEAAGLHLREEVDLAVLEVVGELAEELQVLAHLPELVVGDGLEEQVGLVAAALLQHPLAAHLQP